MLSRLIDFCNIETCDPETIGDYCKKHGLCAYCGDRACEGPDGPPCNLSNVEQTRLEQSVNEYRAFLDECINERRLNVAFVNAKLQYLRGETATYISRLSTGDIGEFDPDTNSERSFYFTEGEDTWKPGVYFSRLGGGTVESFVDAEIVQTLLVEKGELFSKVKKCKYNGCKKYFLYNRPKQVFCSNNCRMTYHNEKDRLSGARHKYYQKKRDEGDEKYY